MLERLVLRLLFCALPAGLAMFSAGPAAAAAPDPPGAAGIPLDFILFGLTLAGVALFHRHTCG